MNWWRRRTLHARLSLLVTGAVAAAVLLVSVAAWLVVAEIQSRQLRSSLTSDAAAIAAQPAQWLDGSADLSTDPSFGPFRGPGPGPGPGPHRGARQLGPRWQILDPQGTVISTVTVALPVTPEVLALADGSRTGSVEQQVVVGHERYLMLSRPVTGGGAVQVAASLDQGHRTLAQFGLLLALCCALGVGAAALLGRAVARAGLVPVQRLTAEVEAVAVSMDLNRPLTVEGADEIARLGKSVNTMLAAIDTSRRAQRALVEDAGHELRTPLTSIRTNIELLLEVERRPERAHLLPAEDRAALLNDLNAQVAELAKLTTELVELSREEATREDVEPVELTQVVRAAISRVRTRAPGLTFAAELTPVTLPGRPGELERMVLNVLDNAAKWSPPGATVTTTLTEDDGTAVLTVTDSGPGIAEQDRPHVFDRFYRATSARSMPGSGLGLAIVAQTATQHGGTVTATPADPQGTTITVRLTGADPLPVQP